MNGAIIHCMFYLGLWLGLLGLIGTYFGFRDGHVVLSSISGNVLGVAGVMLYFFWGVA